MLELILVLMCMMVLINLGSGTLGTSEANLQEHYLKQLHSDIIYAQQYARSNNQMVAIYFSQPDGIYSIRNSSTSVELIRRIGPPKTVVTFPSITNPIRIANDGSFTKSGTVLIEMPAQKLAIRFLLGQGRFYFDPI